MDIKSIIIKSISGQLNTEERLYLDKWLKSGNNRKLYDSINVHLHKSGYYLFNFPQSEIDAVWTKISNDTAHVEKTRRTISITAKAYWIAAAVASIFILCGGIMWYDRYTMVTPPTLSEAVSQAIEQSTSSGRAVIVSKGVPSGESRQSVSPQPVSEGKIAEYQLNPDDVERLLDPKMVETQQTMESWIRLDDGTMVHLGNNSRIVYPKRFPARSLLRSSSLREVIIDGEAYFMVAHDASRPFVVHTSQGDITDYGTEFYVSAKHGSTSVALVSGKVGVKSDVSDEVMLKPSHEARIDSRGKMRIGHIDLDRYVAWNTGKYAFHEIPVRKLVEIISMWYDRKVLYDKDLGYRTVSGVFYKYTSMEETLESLSLVLGVDNDCFTVLDNDHQ